MSFLNNHNQVDLLIVLDSFPRGHSLGASEFIPQTEMWAPFSPPLSRDPPPPSTSLLCAHIFRQGGLARFLPHHTSIKCRNCLSCPRRTWPEPLPRVPWSPSSWRETVDSALHPSSSALIAAKGLTMNVPPPAGLPLGLPSGNTSRARCAGADPAGLTPWSAPRGPWRQVLPTMVNVG